MKKGTDQIASNTALTTLEGQNLAQRIEAQSAVVAVLGLGYVGLPLLLAFCRRGFPVLGFDIDPAKIEALSQGRSYFNHISDDHIEAALDSGRFSITDDYAALKAADALIICVPTPLTKDQEPDLSYVEHTCQGLAHQLRPGQLVVLESTTYPGTTENVVQPILAATGLKQDEEFFLAYSPEREDPGNPDFETTTIPKVIGADSPAALLLADSLYRQVIPHTVPVSSAATAEAVKLTENIFRAVNIALVNELKVIYGAMGLDVWEVIEAAKTKPFGFMPFYPGPGLGGHCIPNDPFYLTWRARQEGIATQFIELAGKINADMPGYVLKKLEEALVSRHGKDLEDAKIFLLGMAYKKNVDDTRESPALEIMSQLIVRGARVDYHDPLVTVIPKTRKFPALAGRQSLPMTESLLAEMDAVVICTDHDDIDYDFVKAHSQLIVDSRNVVPRGPTVIGA